MQITANSKMLKAKQPFFSVYENLNETQKPLINNNVRYSKKSADTQITLFFIIAKSFAVIKLFVYGD